MKKYIVSIESELKEYFEQTVSNIYESIEKYSHNNRNIIDTNVVKEVSILCDNMVSLIEFYVDGIYDSGKNVSRKKMKLNKQIKENERYAFNESDVSFIKDYKENKLTFIRSKIQSAIVSYINYILDNNMDFKNSCQNCLEELVEYIILEIISLFKRAQLEEYKNVGIEKVIYHSEESECLHCSMMKGKFLLISEYLNKSDINNHAFCKYSLNPVVNDKNIITTEKIEQKLNVEHDSIVFNNLPIEMEERLNKLLSKIKIHFNNIFNPMTFNFVDEITQIDIWENEIVDYLIGKDINRDLISVEVEKVKRDLKGKITTFSHKNKVYITNNLKSLKDFEHIIIRELIRNNEKIIVDETINKRYLDKKETKTVGLNIAFYKDGFVNYLSEESAESYLKESIICYLLNPIKLETIDKIIFDYIKKQLENKTWESVVND